MNYQDKTKDELIKKLQKLQLDYDSSKALYKKDITERKLAEEALLIPGILYKEIMDLARDIIFSLTPQGLFGFINQAFEKITGWQIQEWIGKPFMDLLHPEDIPLAAERFSNIMKGHMAQAIELRIRKKSGDYACTEVLASPRMEKGMIIGLLGIARDITERKQAEDALRQSEMKLKTLFDVLPIGVSILDAERNIAFVNPALERILNITKDGFIRGDYKNRKYLRPDGMQMPEEEFASVRAIREQRTVHNVETGVLMEDGHVIWTNVNAAPVAFPDWKVVIITTDITDRKLAEELLRESEERFKQHYQQAPLGYQSLDAEGCFIDINQAWLDLLQYPRDEVLGCWFGDFLAPQEVDAFKQRFSCFKATGEVHVDLEMVQRTGSKIIVHIDGKTGHDEHGQFKQTHCILHDITGRKQAEEALHLEKENFRHSLDDSPLGVRIVTMEGNTIYANQAIVNIYGYDSLEELQKTLLKDRYTPESYLQAQNRKQQRESGNLSATDYEISIVRKNGEIRHLQVYRNEVLWDGVKQFQVIYKDISKRKQAEAALKESEARYRSIFENSLIGITSASSDGRLLQVNPAFARIYGYENPETMFSEVTNVEILYANPKERKELLRILHKNGRLEAKEVEVVRRDGSRFFVLMSASEVKDADGKLLYIQATQVDLTERRKTEEELRKSKELLEKLNQHLNEIREEERALISREIHDELGQSMTALKLDLNRMHKYLDNNPEAAAKLKGIIELVSDTIKDVQRISSDLRPGILDELGLVSAIEWYCDEFEERTGIKCNLKLDDSDYSDSQINLTFFRVLQETLTNVIRHAKASSVNIKLQKQKRGIAMTIKDDGIGIPEEKIRSIKSLGIISMSERVKQFNGTVDISSKKDNGTKLVIFIPS